MDMAFLRRAERMLAPRQPAPLDHPVLLAALAACEVTRGAGQGGIGVFEGPDEPLVELMLGGTGWRRALPELAGCFSRAEAGRRINAA